MSSNQNQRMTQLPASPRYYEIRLEGRLPERWNNWFDGLSISWQAGETLLRGPMADQAALYGLLKKVRDTGLILVAVNQICTKQE